MQLMMNAYKDKDENQEDKDHETEDKELKEILKGVTKRSKFVQWQNVFKSSLVDPIFTYLFLN